QFPSLGAFLGRLQELLKPRKSTDRKFLKQRIQQNVMSGRRHRNGNNGKYRICGTACDPAAPSYIKQMDIGVVDAKTAKGGWAVNSWQILDDGTEDVRRIPLGSGRYHIMSDVASSSSHAHHQVVVDEDLLTIFGALTTWVVDCDPK
ncbi:unnamed protein product, partial [Laminaria digitata]